MAKPTVPEKNADRPRESEGLRDGRLEAAQK